MAKKVTVDPRSPYENVERLVTTEMRPHNMLQGFIRPLYELARGENPVTYDVSQAILNMRNAKVAIVTGIVVEGHLPKGEVDGPIGGAVLGRALSMLGHQVDIMVEAEMDDVVKSLFDGSGSREASSVPPIAPPRNSWTGPTTTTWLSRSKSWAATRKASAIR